MERKWIFYNISNFELKQMKTLMYLRNEHYAYDSRLTELEDSVLELKRENVQLKKDNQEFRRWIEKFLKKSETTTTTTPEDFIDDDINETTTLREDFFEEDIVVPEIVPLEYRTDW